MSTQQSIFEFQATRLADGRAAIDTRCDGSLVTRDTVQLRSAEDRRRCAAEIHNAVPALAISAIERELLAIDPDGLPPVNAGEGEWREPEPVERQPVPLFPVGVLPEPLRSFVSDTAEACQVPADLPALLSLAVCSGAVARRIAIKLNGNWVEPINLFVVCLLEPANRKSTVFTSTTRPLFEIERELIEAAAPTVARLSSDRRIREKELAELERKAAKGCGESRELAGELAAKLATEPCPSAPALLLDDATAEAIEIQLGLQKGRLMVAGSEGGLFDIMGGRYSAGQGNFECFLKGHAGENLRVHRVTREPVLVERCSLTLAYAVQPEVIRGMARQPRFRGRGLIGRFLYAIPKSLLGYRKINANPVRPSVETAYEALIRRLASLVETDDLPPYLLQLTHEARIRNDDFQREIESWLREDGRLAELKDWGGKFAGLTARLAGILHLIATVDDAPWEHPIELGTIEAAITLGRWAVSHAEAVLTLMSGESGPVEDAAYVLRWLRQRAQPDFKRRDVQVHGRSRFDGAQERLDEALELLVDYGWVKPDVNDSSHRGPGRPKSPRYLVHPRLLRDERPTSDPEREQGLI